MKKTIYIEGKCCPHCSGAVEKALAGLAGVSSAKVDLEAKQAVVEANSSISDEMLQKAVADAGYQVTAIE